MNNIFTIIFDDDTVYEGGNNYFETKWMEIPNKNIKIIKYKLPLNKYILLSNFEEYFHMVEVTQQIFGGNIKRIEYAYIMAKKDNNIDVYKINLMRTINNVEIKHYNINDDYIKKLNPSIWKKGIKENK